MLNLLSFLLKNPSVLSLTSRTPCFSYLWSGWDAKLSSSCLFSLILPVYDKFAFLCIRSFFSNRNYWWWWIEASEVLPPPLMILFVTCHFLSFCSITHSILSHIIPLCQWSFSFFIGQLVLEILHRTTHITW